MLEISIGSKLFLYKKSSVPHQEYILGKSLILLFSTIDSKRYIKSFFDPLILRLSGAVAYINIPSSLVSSIAKATPVLLSIVSFVSSLELQIIS